MSQAEWDAALAVMTEREEAVAAEMHDLAAARKRMPMVRVEQEYRFEGRFVDFGVDEWFGLNVFLRDGDDVYRTYFLQHGPMVQSIGSVWTVFSLTPYGGQCDDEDLPEGWPAAPQSFWYRRHDEFNDPPPSATGG